MGNLFVHPDSWFWRWGAAIVLCAVVLLFAVLLLMYSSSNEGDERHTEFEWQRECVAVIEVSDGYGRYSFDRLEEC